MSQISETTTLNLASLSLDELSALRAAVQEELLHRGGGPWFRCPACRGVGALDDGSYCFCQLGRDLSRVEKKIRYE